LARETPSFDRGGSRGGADHGIGADRGGMGVERGGRDRAASAPTPAAASGPRADDHPAAKESAPIAQGQDKPPSSVGVVHDIPTIDGVSPVGAIAKDVRVDTTQRSDTSSATTVRSSSDRVSPSATVISQPNSRGQPNGGTGVTVGASIPFGGAPSQAAPSAPPPPH
jgi:hypothetical protein